jgi:hypothetical protein
MRQREWISAVWRLKRVAAAARPASLALRAPTMPRLPRDDDEQAERIRNLAADTALKLQSIDHAKIYLRLAVLTVFLALGSLLIAAASLYLTHNGPPKSHNPSISGAPHQENMI